MASEQWFCQIEGKQYGPFSGEQLKTLVSQGKLLPTHLLRQGPQGQWVQATRAKGLFPAAPTTTPQSKPSGLLVAKPLDDPPAAAAQPVPMQPQAPVVPGPGAVLDAIPVVEAVPQVVEVAEVHASVAPAQAVAGVPTIDTGEPANPFAIQTESPIARVTGGRPRGRAGYSRRTVSAEGVDQTDTGLVIAGLVCLALVGIGAFLPWVAMGPAKDGITVAGIDGVGGKVVLAGSLLIAVFAGVGLAEKRDLMRFGTLAGSCWGTVVTVWTGLVLIVYLNPKMMAENEFEEELIKMLNLRPAAGLIMVFIFSIAAAAVMAAPFFRLKSEPFVRQQVLFFCGQAGAVVLAIVLLLLLGTAVESDEDTMGRNSTGELVTEIIARGEEIAPGFAGGPVRPASLTCT